MAKKRIFTDKRFSCTFCKAEKVDYAQIILQDGGDLKDGFWLI